LSSTRHRCGVAEFSRGKRGESLALRGLRRAERLDILATLHHPGDAAKAGTTLKNPMKGRRITCDDRYSWLPPFLVEGSLAAAPGFVEHRMHRENRVRCCICRTLYRRRRNTALPSLREAKRRSDPAFVSAA